MTRSVACTVGKTAQAETILNKLLDAGFSNSNISVLFPDREDTKHFVQEKHTKAPEGAATGASTGGVIGGIIGWMVGIGSLAIPGVGPFIAAGPILAALSGTAIGAALGGLTGTLIGLGIPEYEAKIYESKIKAGSILISVQTQDLEVERRQAVLQIFKDANADDISQLKAA